MVKMKVDCVLEVSVKLEEPQLEVEVTEVPTMRDQEVAPDEATGGMNVEGSHPISESQ